MFKRNFLVGVSFGVLLTLSSTSEAQEIPVFSIVSEIHGNADIEKAAECLSSHPYKFAIGMQASIMQCSQNLSLAILDDKSSYQKLNACIGQIMQKTEGFNAAKWQSCYNADTLESIAKLEIKRHQQAVAEGSAKVGKIFKPKEACKIRTTSNEYFNLDDREIFIRAGTELPIVSAGGDAFRVLVGTNSFEDSEGPIDYRALNCPKHFIEAISAYDFKENSNYDQAFYAIQDIIVTSDISQKKVLCKISKGTNLENVIYSENPVDDWEYQENKISIPEESNRAYSVGFDAESAECAGIEGYMNGGAISAFVIPPALGFLNNINELPSCTASVDTKSAFIARSSDGPDLRSCRFIANGEPGHWCGKNSDNCIEK